MEQQEIEPTQENTLDTSTPEEADLLSEAVAAIADDEGEAAEEPETPPEEVAAVEPESSPEEEPEEEPEEVEAKAGDEPEEGQEGVKEDEVSERTWKAVKRQQKETREIKAKLREMKGQVATIEKERDHYKSYAQQFNQELAGNPLAKLRSVGIDFETVARQLLADGRPQQPQQQPQTQKGGEEEWTPREKAMLARLEAVEAAQGAQAVGTYEQGVRKAVAETSPLLQSLGDKGINLVISKASEYASAQEPVPEVADLLSEVEAAVRDELKPLISHEAVLNEFGLVAGAKDKKGQSGEPEVTQGRRSAPRALTNSARGAAPATKAPARPIHELSEQEQIELAVAAM